MRVFTFNILPTGFLRFFMGLIFDLKNLLMEFDYGVEFFFDCAKLSFGYSGFPLVAISSHKYTHICPVIGGIGKRVRRISKKRRFIYK